MNGAASSGCVASAASHVGGCRESDPSSVGMMEGAFFVGRSELLDWLNSTLALKLTRVEQCASGCVYIQALDAMLGPKSRVAMSKVKWGARHEYEFIQNFKVLQAAFDAHGIQKYIEVNKLVRAKYQDNLEFLQWLKAFVDRQAPLFASGVPYNPIERRRLGMGPFPDWAPVGGSSASASKSAINPTSHHTPSTASASSRPPSALHSQPRGASLRSTANSTTPTNHSINNQPNNSNSRSASSAASVSSETRRLQREVQRLQRLLQQQPTSAAATANLQAEFEQAVLERDFYYQKLRRIELLCCGANQEALPVKQIQEILYAKDEEEEEHAAAQDRGS